MGQIRPFAPWPESVNILVVDDQAANLMSYEVVLAAVGERVIKASAARVVFECLLRTDVALILKNVCMPRCIAIP